ncbi:MAG: cupin domain-containing protein [Sedimentisphaerales bacterium]|nr:cupin domain-containing protein [Sedimentisphaerales bacterium]
MTDKEEKSSVLTECLGKGQKLLELIDYANDSIVSKTLLDKSVGTLTLFAFDKGQKLSEHTAPYDAVVQILDGKAHVRIQDDINELAEGQIIIMPANVPHAVNAGEKFKMLLTMIRA